MPNRFIGYKFGNWTIVSFIGKGSSGEIYNVKNNNDDMNDIPKIIKISLYMSLLNEINVYKYIKNYSLKTPKMFDHGMIESDKIKIYYLVLEKITNSPSIEQMKSIRNPIIFIKLVKDVLKTLKTFHSLNIIHSDIKPDNILLKILKDKVEDRNNSFMSKIEFIEYVSEGYLIDFGLSTNKGKRDNIFGTILYMSRDAHNCKASFKSDIESLFFTLISLIYKNDTLPWYQYIVSSENPKFKKNLETIYDIKNNVINYYKERPDVVYTNLSKYAAHLENIKDEMPDHDLLISYLDDLMEEIIVKDYLKHY